MRLAATVVYMHVSPHRSAYCIAEHGTAMIVRREFTPVQLYIILLRAIDGPSCLRHWPMVGFMLLRMP